MKILIFVLASACSFGVMSKNLGSMGSTFPIQEPSMLEYIKQKGQELESSGKLATLQQEAEERIREHAIRPTPVSGYSKVTIDRTFYVEPIHIVPADITDLDGNIIARAGQKINSLEVMAIKGIKFDKELIFIDGDSIEQRKWVKKNMTAKTKIILINGNVKESEDYIGAPIFFDQYGSISRKYGLSKVPTIITADGFRLAVHEVNIHEN